VPVRRSAASVARVCLPVDLPLAPPLRFMQGNSVSDGSHYCDPTNAAITVFKRKQQAAFRAQERAAAAAEARKRAEETAKDRRQPAGAQRPTCGTASASLKPRRKGAPRAGGSGILSRASKAHVVGPAPSAAAARRRRPGQMRKTRPPVGWTVTSCRAPRSLRTSLLRMQQGAPGLVSPALATGSRGAATQHRVIR